MPILQVFPDTVLAVDPCPDALNRPIHSGYAASVWQLGAPNYQGPLNGAGQPTPASTYAQWHVTPPCAGASIVSATVYWKVISAASNVEAFKVGDGTCAADGAEGSNTGNMFPFAFLAAGGTPQTATLSNVSWGTLDGMIATFYSMQDEGVVRVEVEYLYVEIDYTCPTATITSSKTTTPTSVKPGETATHVVVVQNNGGATGTATVVDPCPAGHKVKWTAVPSGTASGHTQQAAFAATGINDTVSLAPGAKVTYTITQEVAPASNVGATTSNTSTVTPAAGGGTATVRTGATVTVTNPIEITKAGQAGAAPGATAVHTFTVSNNSAGQVDGVAVSDPIPTGVAGLTGTWTRTVTGGTTGGAASGSFPLTDTLATMPTGATATYTCSFVVPAGATFGSKFKNTATADCGNYPVSSSAETTITNPNAGAVSLGGTVILCGCDADLATSSKVGPATAEGGDPISWTVTVVNTGGGKANNVTLTDAVPANCTGITITPASYVKILPGESKTFTVTSTINPGYAGTITNTGVVNWTNDDGVTKTQTVTAATVVLAPDIDIAKTVSTAQTVAGQPVTWEVVVRNIGQGGARNLVFADVVPSATQVTGWSNDAIMPSAASGGAGQNVTFNVPFLPAGGQFKVLINGTAQNPTGVFTNTASVTATGVAAKTAAAQITIVEANLSASTKVATPATQLQGKPVVFTVTVKNSSAANAANVTVADVVPAAFTGVTWTAPGATPANGTGNNINVTYPVLLGNSQRQITINATAATTGNHINTVTIAATNIPAFTKTAAVTVQAPNLVTSTKTASVASLFNGSTLTFTIAIKNTGDGDAENVTVSDIVPAAFQVTSWTAVGATVTAGSTNNISTGYVTIPAGSTRTIIVNATAVTQGAHTNTVTIAADRVAPFTKTANVTVIGPNFSTSSKTGPATAISGDTIDYTVTVVNTGGTAQNVTITDVHPNLTINTVTPASVAVLPNGATAVFTVNATVNQATPPGILTNVATITATGATSVNVAHDTVISSAVDLRLTKTTSSTKAIGGTSIIYTAILENAGPAQMLGVVFNDPLPTAPAGRTRTWVRALATGALAANTASQASNGTGSYSQTFNLPVGARVTLTATDTVPLGTTDTIMENTASAFIPAGYVDPNGCPPVTVTLPIEAPLVDLTLTKTVDRVETPTGEMATWTVVFRNLGPTAVTLSPSGGVRFEDAIPLPVSARTWTRTTSGGAISAAPVAGTGAIDHLWALPVGSQVTYVIKDTIPLGSTGSSTNCARLTLP